MEIEFFDKALEDIDFWKKSGNKSVQTRLINCLKASAEHLFQAWESQNH